MGRLAVSVASMLVATASVARADDPADPAAKPIAVQPMQLAGPVTTTPVLRDELARSIVVPTTNIAAAATPATDSSDRKQWIFEGIGGAAIVAGGVLLWYSRHHAERAPPIGVVVTENAAFASWTGSW